MIKLKNKLKKIFIITGSRADYDLLKPIIIKLKKSDRFKVNVVVTGSHFIKNHNTFTQIERDNIKINNKIKIKYKGDTETVILNFFAEGVKRFNNLFKKNKPDGILVLGDRYEIFSAVISASFYRIPIIHLSGGEVTEGAIDEPIRHSISKFSSFHFVTNLLYKKRIIQLGEDPKSIFHVGSTGVENIKRFQLFTKKEIKTKLGFSLRKKNYLITFHPVTFQFDYGLKDFKILLTFLLRKKNDGMIFTLPNSDVSNLKIRKLIKKFVSKHKHAKYYTSLGKNNYFSFVKNVDYVIGNSSSGLSEVPSFKKPTINLGIRQRGRIFAKSVINIQEVNLTNLEQAFKKASSKKFKKVLARTKNPYFKKGTTDTIIKILKKIDLKKMRYKKFIDIKESYK